MRPRGLDYFPKERTGGRSIGLWMWVVATLLTGLLLALFGSMQRTTTPTPQEVAALHDMLELHDALGRYCRAIGDYPTTAQGLASLTQQGTDGLPPFIARVPVDPWGHPYIYRYDGSGMYQLLSAGKDGKEGTKDDIVWQP